MEITKSITTSKGSTITVEMVREVGDKMAYLDGLNEKSGREVIEYTNVTLTGADGKTIVRGKLNKLSPEYNKEMCAAGAVARINNVYLKQDMYDLIADLISQVENENPKSDEQIKIEAAQAKQEENYTAWYNSPEQVASRRLTEMMDDPDSDL